MDFATDIQRPGNVPVRDDDLVDLAGIGIGDIEPLAIVRNDNMLRRLAGKDIALDERLVDVNLTNGSAVGVRNEYRSTIARKHGIVWARSSRHERFECQGVEIDDTDPVCGRMCNCGVAAVRRHSHVMDGAGNLNPAHYRAGLRFDYR